MIGNQLIPTLGRQYLSRNNDCARANQTHTPANSTKDPGLVKSPADEEPVFVIVQISLVRQLGPISTE